MFDITIKSSLEKFVDLYLKELTSASRQAVKATANDAIKVTLPNTLNNVDKNKPASKQKSTYNKNLKALKDRIKKDIIGDGIEGSGIPTAIPAADGNPIPSSIRGIAYMPYMLLAKPKGSKRRTKIRPRLTANNADDLIQHIKRHTHLKSKKVTYRQRNNSTPIMWITKPSIAKQAASQMQLKAGNLLSGWSALAEKAAENSTNMLSGLLSKQQVGKKGSATITSTPGETSILAYNDEVNEKKQGYQQQVVDSTLSNSFKYHLQNAIDRINTKSIKNKSKNIKL